MMRIKCKYITMSGKCLKHSTPSVNEYCVESPCEDYEGFGTDELMVLKARNRQRNKKIQRLIDNLMKEHYTQHEVELLLKAAKDDNDD